MIEHRAGFLLCTNRPPAGQQVPRGKAFVRRRDILGAADGKIDGASIYVPRGEVFVRESAVEILEAIVAHDTTWRCYEQALELVTLFGGTSIDARSTVLELRDRAAVIARDWKAANHG